MLEVFNRRGRLSAPAGRSMANSAAARATFLKHLRQPVHSAGQGVSTASKATCGGSRPTCSAHGAASAQRMNAEKAAHATTPLHARSAHFAGRCGSSTTGTTPCAGSLADQIAAAYGVDLGDAQRAVPDLVDWWMVEAHQPPTSAARLTGAAASHAAVQRRFPSASSF
jgi:hypothetical protein